MNQHSLSSPIPSAASLPTQRKEQEKLLGACNARFHDLLNLEVLFPHLVQEGLLTRYEMERLQHLSPTLPDEASKVDHLLKIIPRKGKKALKRFVKCLQRTEDGTAHDELVRLMTEASTQGYESINKNDFTGTKTGMKVIIISIQWNLRTRPHPIDYLFIGQTSQNDDPCSSLGSYIPAPQQAGTQTNDPGGEEKMNLIKISLITTLTSKKLCQYYNISFPE